MNYDDELGRARQRSRSRQASQMRTSREGQRHQRQMEQKRAKGQMDSSRERKSRRPYDSAYRETAASDTSGYQSRSKGNHNHKKTDRRKKQRIWIIVAEVMLLLGIIAFTVISFVKQKMDLIQRLPFDTSNIENLDLSSEKKEQMKGYWTIAVFGVDDRGTVLGKGTNADVNLICNINRDTGEIKMVSVFRDTYLNISDKNSYNKINQAYFLGGPEQAVGALNKNLDLNITDYATFNWKAVAEGINILGGIDLEISKAEFYYINAFITETVKATGIYSQHLSKAGMQHLDGVQAVAYGRLRLMDTDFARTERQRKVISLAFEKAKTANWATLNNIIETVFPNVATNIDVKDVVDAAWDIKKYHISETGGFPFARGDARMGNKGACVIPQTLESNVIQLHQFLFDDMTYVPTETVKAISKKIAADSGMYKEGKPVDKVDTDGGYIPKETKVTAESTKVSTEETTETSSGEFDPSQSLESSTAPGNINRPGGDASGWESWETDANGNYIDPAWPSTNPSGATRPGTTQPGTTQPGTTQPTTAVAPGTPTGQRPTESSAMYPGGTTAPGNNTPGNNPPGMTTSPTQGTASYPTAATTAPAPGNGMSPGNRPGAETPTTGSGGPGTPGNNYPGTGSTTAANQGNISFEGPGGR